LREILRQQDQTIRNLNDDLAQNRQTIREHENTIRTLTARNNDLTNQINGILADHSNHFTRINNNLDQIIKTPNPDLVNRLNRISQSVDGLQTQLQPLRNDLTEIKDLIKNLANGNRTGLANLTEKINEIDGSLNRLLNLRQNDETVLNEMNETLRQIKSEMDSRHRERSAKLRCTCENFINRCNEYVPNNFMVFFSFIIFLLGIFYCICGNGKYGSCTMNNCMKSC